MFRVWRTDMADSSIRSEYEKTYNSYEKCEAWAKQYPSELFEIQDLDTNEIWFGSIEKGFECING